MKVIPVSTAVHLSVSQHALRTIGMPDNHHAHNLQTILKNDLITKLNNNKYGMTDFNYRVYDIVLSKMLFTHRF